MKKTFLLAAISATVLFFSCSKEKEKTENRCPVVPASAVPQVVKDSFAVRYPATTVTTWFNKDSVAFCAYFLNASVEKLAQFANNGSFIKEQIETHQDEEHEDGDSTSTIIGGKVVTVAGGCKCETHNDKEGD